MQTCPYCFNDFTGAGFKGGFCSRRCFAVDRRDENTGADQDDRHDRHGPGLFKSIQGGLMKFNHGLAEDELVLP